MKARLIGWLGLVRASWDRFQADDGPTLAAAVAYYLGLSLFPLMLVLLAGLGWFLQFTAAGQSAEDQFLETVSAQLSPTLVVEVKNTLSLVRSRASVQGPVGLLVMLTTTLAAFSQFERGLDRIWNIPDAANAGLWGTVRKLLIQRGVSFLMLLVMGFFLVVVFATMMTLSALRSAADPIVELPSQIWSTVQSATALLLNMLLLTAIYRWLPKRRPRWREAAAGALLAGILWEIGRNVLAYFLIGASYSSAYGIVGSFIAILLWCYYAMTVVFLGAEYVHLASRVRRWQTDDESEDPSASDDPPTPSSIGDVAQEILKDAHRSKLVRQ